MCVTTRPAESAAVARARDDASCRWRGSTPSTRRRRVAPMARDSLDTTDAGRGAPHQAAAGEDAGQEVQDAHVPLRRGHVPLRRELLLRAQRRCLPRGTQNSSRRRRESGSVRAQEEPGRASPTSRQASRPTSSRLERLRALRDSGSVSAVEFEVLKQQVLREPGSFAAQAPVLLAPTAPPPPRRLSPPPPDAYMPPAMAMPPRAVPRPPAYAPQPPYAAVPGPPRGYGVPRLYLEATARRRHRGRRFPGTRLRPRGAAAAEIRARRAAAGSRDVSPAAAAARPPRAAGLSSHPPSFRMLLSHGGCRRVSAPAGTRPGSRFAGPGWRAFLASMCSCSIHIAAATAPANRRAPLASFEPEEFRKSHCDRVRAAEHATRRPRRLSSVSLRPHGDRQAWPRRRCRVVTGAASSISRLVVASRRHDRRRGRLRAPD